MARRPIKLDRQEMINLLQEVAFDEGQDLSLETYLRLTGVPRNRVYSQFGSWVKLKAAAGLPPARPRRNTYSDDDVLSALHEIIQRLRRFPRQYEIKNEAGLSYQVLYSRWGDMQNIAARYRRWLSERQHKDQEALNLPQRQKKNVFEDMPDAGAADVRWLRRTWQGMKVAFELHSSDFQGRPSHLCDLLIVLRHDWLACPVKVLELADILPQHQHVEPRQSDSSFSPY